MSEGHRIHGLTPAQVVALIEERDTLREALEIQQRLMRPNVVMPAAWRLGPAEADTLMAIRAAAPDLVSRDRIFVAVYGALNDDLPDECIIYQRITHIRRKLRAAGVAVTIETIPARGYRMDLASAKCLDRAIAANRRSPGHPTSPTSPPRSRPMAHNIALPPIPDAPHWRATTPDELGDIFGTTFPPGAFDLLPGWDLAFFTGAPQHRGTVAPRDGDRCTQIGWVKGSFAATQFPIDPQVHQQIGGLVHLPTGYRVASFYSAEEAANAAELIADCCDWSTITPDTVGRVGRDAMERLADGGFQWVALVTGDVTTRILSRILTVAH